jgi:hypothetical protein
MTGWRGPLARVSDTDTFTGLVTQWVLFFCTDSTSAFLVLATWHFVAVTTETFYGLAALLDGLIAKQSEAVFKG